MYVPMCVCTWWVWPKHNVYMHAYVHTYIHTYIQGSFQRKESDFNGPLTVFAGQQRVSICVHAYKHYVCIYLRPHRCISHASTPKHYSSLTLSLSHKHTKERSKKPEAGHNSTHIHVQTHTHRHTHTHTDTHTDTHTILHSRKLPEA